MRLGQWISLLALAISVYLVWQIRQVLLLVFAAVVLATALNRVVRILQRWHVKRGIAVAISVVLLLLTLFGLFAILLPRLIEQIQQLSDTLPQAIEQVRVAYEWLQSKISGRVLTADQPTEGLLQNLQAWISDLLGNFIVIVTNSVSVFLRLLLFVVATVMLLINPSQYRHVFILAFPAFYRPRINEILDECEDSLVGWVRGTLITMVAIGVFSYVGLLILGIPLPLVNALIAGLLEFIPNVGPTLSVIPPALLALLDAPWKSLAVIGLYILIQQFESLILVPIVMKREASLLPLFTLLSVVIFSALFGFLGLFLAVPLLIVLQIWLKEVLVKDILNPWQKNTGNHKRVS